MFATFGKSVNEHVGTSMCHIVQCPNTWTHAMYDDLVGCGFLITIVRLGAVVDYCVFFDQCSTDTVYRLTR